jgi:hypothetical protein
MVSLSDILIADQMRLEKMSFRFCPGCGEYRHLNLKARDFTFAQPPSCPHCQRPLEITGLAILLFGICISLSIALVQYEYAGGEEPVEAIFCAFAVMAAVRWIRHFRAKRRNTTNRVPGSS